VLSAAFRVDSSLWTGSGHFSRCYSIAKELLEQGVKCHFIAEQIMPWQVELLNSSGVRLHRIGRAFRKTTSRADFSNVDFVSNPKYQELDGQKTNSILQDISPTYLFVDSYLAGDFWARKITYHCKKILITDFPYSIHGFQHAVLPGLALGLDSDKRTLENGATLQSGPLLAPLDQDFRKWSGLDVPSDTHKKTLIYLGSGDYMEHLGHLIKSWDRHDFGQLTIVSSGASARLSRLRPTSSPYILGLDLPVNLPNLIRTHDAFLGAAGVSMLERLSKGAMSALALVASNQTESYDLAIRNGLGHGIGTLNSMDVDHVLEAIELSRRDSTNPTKRVFARSISDGYGSQRILYLCDVISLPKVRIRPVLDTDISTLFRISNDQGTRSMSLSKTEISASEHISWFSSKRNSQSEMFLAELNGCPVGLVRFDRSREENRTIMSFAIDKPFRGMGLSKQVLEQALDKRKTREQVVAQVRNENLASIKVLISVGFRKNNQNSNHNGEAVSEFLL
jgi:UDP-2,4-diacetamido-2,4,6-trideoxy-beta-L-altropyranose hydrolase